MILYDLAVMGAPSGAQVAEVERYVAEIIQPFRLRLGHEVAWHIGDADFTPSQTTPAAVVFFGANGVSDLGLDALLARGIPVLPVIPAGGSVSADIPLKLRPLNCLNAETDGIHRIATGLLECVGLLPRQRRVFVSYRRDLGREAALQLFDELSSRLFDVFLDTHGIAPAEDFQAVLWHRLCDSDVLVMLDTPGYFESRWTSAEFGRALAKGISVLRVGWPAVNASPRTLTASHLDLAPADIEANGRLTAGAIERIGFHLEFVRARSHAVRSLNLFSNLEQAVVRIGGKVAGVGIHQAIYLTLPDGKELVVFPAVGVPTSVNLNEASEYANGRPVAVVYDHVGLHPRWLDHLTWLGKNIAVARWLKSHEAAWALAGWEVP
jgi:hypothetical protein